MSNNESCCLAKILKVIDILQKKQKGDVCFDTGCTKPIFGPVLNVVCYNTRPVTLYNKDNSLFTVNYDGGSSNIFRVEDVDGCCAKLAVLSFNSDENTYSRTGRYVTVNLKCFCAVKCLDDAYVEC